MRFWILVTVACWLTSTFLGLAPALAEVTVTGARLGGTEERTRFVADLSGIPQYSATTLSNPDRVVIDLGKAKFKLPGSVSSKIKGLVKKLTYGIVSEGQSQFILETAGNVLIDKSYVIEPKGRQPARLVLDLVRADAPPQQESLANLTQTNDTSWTVVIDAGHGGIDPGAVSSRNVQEKDVVFNFAKVLRDVLSEIPSINVVMTRDSDVFLPLKRRVEIARENNADLLIAIHADIIRGKTARGTTLYTLSEKASDAEAEAFAAKENRSDLVAGVDVTSESAAVSDVLIELLHRESKHLSMVFAKKSARELSKVTIMAGKPIRSAGFVVLKAPDVPSVLIELGFLSSKEDEKRITDPVWQRSTATALSKAVVDYLANESGVESADQQSSSIIDEAAAGTP